MYRIRQAITDNVPVTDVDGSYQYKKRKALEDSEHVLAPFETPSDLSLVGKL